MDFRAFDGVRVVELAQWVFVPVAGALLADWGADVIHAEPLYPPAVVAKQVADIDRACGGRVVFGVGVGGEYPQEFRACQIPLAERGRRTDEAILLLRQLWSARQISHDGAFYPVQDVRVHPAPAQPGGPPIVIAGRKEPAMRRAASPSASGSTGRRAASQYGEVMHEAATGGVARHRPTRYRPASRPCQALRMRRRGGRYPEGF
jgi:alkanesulfonate monooxygenase SsuD/methylene tetrahydromethanopterin reductase-like flavin-dependent oxidoreductase (luciferase family)